MASVTVTNFPFEVPTDLVGIQSQTYEILQQVAKGRCVKVIAKSNQSLEIVMDELMHFEQQGNLKILRFAEFSFILPGPDEVVTVQV